MKKSILILFFALLGVLSAQAYDFEAGGIYYDIISGTDEVEVSYRLDYSGYQYRYSGSIVIPATVTYNGDTYRVTAIKDWAFQLSLDLTSVTIGENVTSIGACAFTHSGLRSVTIPESVTFIGGNAFEGSRLTSVEWNAVDCQDFELGRYGKALPFYDCDITSFTFGNQVKHIPANLCYGLSGLTSVTIPESVTSVGASAFMNCSGLTSVEWNAVVCPDFEYSSGSPFYNCKNITTITFGNQVKHIPANLCDGLSDLTSVTIPEGVTSIGENAFAACFGLTSVEWNAVACQDFKHVPNYLDYDLPFYMCDNITSVTFGNQVERIPAYLCYLMFHITSVTIPESVTSIGSSAFANCFGLKSVTSLARKPPYCDSAVFSNHSHSATLYVPKGCKEAYRTAQEWCNFFNIEEISDNPNDPDNPDDPDDPDTPTANENAGADNFRVYVQDRTIYLSEDRGTVQVYNMAGQRIYNGRSTAIPIPQSGVYVLVTNGQRLKVLVR